VRRALAGGVVALAATVAAGCVWGRHGQERWLPADRGAAVVYVALGDSTVEGIGATASVTNYVSRLHRRLAAIYPRASVVNLGVGGATSADVVTRQLDGAVALAPTLVTLSIGPNDITGGIGVETYERNVKTILRRLTGETSAVVVANLLPDLAVTPRFRATPDRDAVGAQTVRFNEALRRQARAFDAELVDLYGPSREEVPLHPDLIAHDGYHPSDAGYERWAELVWKVIERRIAVQ
jgi:lysophospholipase L1-like esterase